KKLTAMTRDQIIKLLQYTKSFNSDWYIIYRVMYELGLRSGEGLALRWDSIDFENNFVTIDASYCSKSKKIKSTKSGEARTLPINSDLRAFLKELKLRTGQQEFVLPQLKEWKRGEAAKVLRQIQTELNIPLTNFHSLR